MKVWISFSPGIFFTNLLMTTEWAFAFLNIVIIVFCLIYSLNIPHSNQNLPFFPFGGSQRNYNHRKTILTFLFVRFYHCHARHKITCYIVWIPFPGPQSKLSWVSQVYELLWECQKETHILAQRNMIEHRLFASEPIGSLFIFTQ